MDLERVWGSPECLSGCQRVCSLLFRVAETSFLRLIMDWISVEQRLSFRVEVPQGNPYSHRDSLPSILLDICFHIETLTVDKGVLSAFMSQLLIT